MSLQEMMWELRRERRSRKITQLQASTAIGFSVHAVNQMEKLVHIPSYCKVEDYANFLGFELVLKKREEK